MSGVELVESQEVFAHIAQSVEHFLGKEEVIGSIPIVSTRWQVVGKGSFKSGMG